MVRRSFRVGLRLGLLAGVLVAVVKVVQSRRSTREEAWAPPASEASWPPLQPEPVAVEPLAPTVIERVAPVRRAPAEAPSRAPVPPAVTPARPSPSIRAGAEGAELAADGFDAAAPAAAAQSLPPMAPAPSTAEVPNPWAPPSTVEPVPPVTAEPEPPKVAARTAAPAAVAPARPAPARARVRKARHRPWVEPVGNETPPSHPVKAKVRSMLYHLPGMAFYNRTHPDRCYVDAAAAEADGFTRAKR